MAGAIMLQRSICHFCIYLHIEIDFNLCVKILSIELILRKALNHAPLREARTIHEH